MGRKKGISTHRKNAKKKQADKLYVNNFRRTITTRSTKKENETIIDDDKSKGCNKNETSISKSNGEDITELPSPAKASHITKCTRNRTNVENHMSPRTKSRSTDDLHLTPRSRNN